MQYVSIILFLGLSFIGRVQESNPYFYPFKDKEGWGLKRSNGEELFKERYDDVVAIYGLYKNRIRVQKNGKWGVVDSNGVNLIPVEYASLKVDEWGYEAFQVYQGDSILGGYLNLKGDTIAPFSFEYVYTEGVGNNGDFIVLCEKDINVDRYAIFSSDGVRRTDFDFDEIIGIDSLKMMKSVAGMTYHYFGVHSVTTDRYGIYDAVHKRMVVPPVYDGLCATWCHIDPNPLTRPGPIVYTGNNPVFILELKGMPVVLNTAGDIIFLASEFNDWNLKNRYYVNEAGIARKVVGKCKEKDREAYPGYIMEDTQGYFVIDQRGVPVFGNERYTAIDRLMIKEDEQYKTSYYRIQKGERWGLFDLKLNQKLPFEYTSIDYDNELNYFHAVDEDNSRKYWDAEFNPLEKDPKRIVRESFFFSENKMRGIMSKDSAILVSPKYTRTERIGKQDTDSDTVFYILSNSETVDIYNEQLKLIHHFDAAYYSFYSRFKMQGRSYLLLVDNSKSGVFDLASKKWVLKDVLCTPYSEITSRDDRKKIPALKIYGDKLLLRVYNEKSGWVYFDEKGTQLFEWNRWTSVLPEIVYADESGIKLMKMQETDGDKVSTSYLVNGAGDELIIEGPMYVSHVLPELKRILIKYEPRRNVVYEYDSAFNLLDSLKGTVKTGTEFMIHFDWERKNYQVTGKCRVIGKDDFVHLSDTAKWVNGVDVGFYDVLTKEGHHVVSNYTVRNGIKLYGSSPWELSTDLWACRYHGAEEWTVDIFSAEGDLLFEGYRIVSKGNNNFKNAYIVIENGEEELWITRTGEVYHRNVL